MNWWHLKYVGRPLSLIARIKVWFWLKRCERIIKREMAKDAETDKYLREDWRNLGKDLKNLEDDWRRIR